MSIMTFLDTEMAFCLWFPCSAPRLNSKILNFLNNHFGHSLANLGAKCFSHIHARGNKSGRQIWDTFWQIFVRNVFLIYMRVEINQAGKFWCKIFVIRYVSIMAILDTEMAFCLWLPCSALRLNSKILNFSNNHFGHLTSVHEIT